jgi:hypothetical protein
VTVATDVRSIASAPLTDAERQRLAALVVEKGWTPRDLKVLALRHVDRTGSKNPAMIARWLLTEEA